MSGAVCRCEGLTESERFGHDCLEYDTEIATPAGAGTEPDTEPRGLAWRREHEGRWDANAPIAPRGAAELVHAPDAEGFECVACGDCWPCLRARGASEGPQPDPPRGWLCGSDGSCPSGTCSECQP